MSRLAIAKLNERARVELDEAAKIESNNAFKVAEGLVRGTAGLPSTTLHYDRAAAIALVSIAASLEIIMLDGIPSNEP